MVELTFLQQKQVKDAGATIVVAGTFIFNYEDRKERIESLK